MTAFEAMQIKNLITDVDMLRNGQNDNYHLPSYREMVSARYFGGPL